jgi:NAD(P)-dependent dehydrogenase (short-subunit alcohol dehydrogenase family)
MDNAKDTRPGTVADRFSLAGKVAIVTGGSRGLGRAMVRAFAEAGADVVIASRKLDACEAAAKEVETVYQRRALPVSCHVGKWNEVEDLAERAYETFGHVDVLVNNAGMSPLYDRVVDVSEEMWDRVVGVNLKGPFRLTAIVGTRMAEAGGGSIINVSSIGAEMSDANTIPYSAAKAGLNAMTKGFAQAFGPTVRVNGIMPGSFLTDIATHWDMDAFRAVAQTFALRRGGEADEIVGAALYFASAASSYTTGALLRIDGGVRRA